MSRNVFLSCFSFRLTHTVCVSLEAGAKVTNSFLSRKCFLKFFLETLVSVFTFNKGRFPVFHLLNLLKNLFVVAGAKVPPLLCNSSFLLAFFRCFFNFDFKTLKTRLLKAKVFSSTLQIPKRRTGLSQEKGVLPEGV